MHAIAVPAAGKASEGGSEAAQMPNDRRAAPHIAPDMCIPSEECGSWQIDEPLVNLSYGASGTKGERLKLLSHPRSGMHDMRRQAGPACVRACWGGPSTGATLLLHHA